VKLQKLYSLYQTVSKLLQNTQSEFIQFLGTQTKGASCNFIKYFFQTASSEHILKFSYISVVYYNLEKKLMRYIFKVPNMAQAAHFGIILRNYKIQRSWYILKKIL